MLGRILALAVATLSVGTLASTGSKTNGTACQVARHHAEFGIGSQLKPSIALACLGSVPLAKDHDTKLINFLVPYIEQQSTLGFLKNPPESYLFPPVDLIGGLNQIKDKVAAAGYKSQLEFAWDVNTLFNQVFDGHFDYKPALLNIFGFQASRSLKSVSRDGLELPKVYDEEDLKKAGRKFTPSPIVTIDGLPVVEYLEIIAASSALQDPDAQYNNLFTTSATIARGGGGYFRSGGYVELPDVSVYKYANGTKKSFPNFAILQQDLTGIENGYDLHLAYEIPAPPQPKASPKAVSSTPKPKSKLKSKTKSLKTKIKSKAKKLKSKVKSKAKKIKSKVSKSTSKKVSKNSTATATKKPATRPTVVGYPYPVVKHYNDYIAGYFLNDTKYKDVAVLSIYAFSPKGAAQRTDTEFTEYRRVVRTFIEKCREAKRTKLIIDVQANGGGMLMQSYELYRNLFPNAKAPFDGTRLRVTDAFNLIGKDVYGTSRERPAINNMLDKDEQRYKDWDSLWGPVDAKKDKVTNLLRYDFANNDTVGEPGFTISGYNKNDSPPDPHFEAKNILFVTDGFCASTCTVLGRLLTREQGVRTLALGGRPLKAPMQAIGGVKGAQVIKYQVFQDMLKTAINNLPKDAEKPENLPEIAPAPLLPALSSLQFNFRNAYYGTEDQIPLQFTYEAASCRRFYTYKMTAKPTEVWKVAADVAFHGARCVENSATGRGDTMSTATAKLNRKKVASRLVPYDGPGSNAYSKKKLSTRAVGPRSVWARKRSAQALEARMESWKRDLSEHDKMLLNKSPKEVERAGWWDHPGF